MSPVLQYALYRSCAAFQDENAGDYRMVEHLGEFEASQSLQEIS